MRVCADCKFHELRRATVMRQDFCQHPKSRHPVTGEPRLCVNARGICAVESLDDGLPGFCGGDAKLWEPA